MKNNIKSIAKKKGVKLQDLMMKTNLSSSTFSMMVNGKRPIDPENMIEICKFLDCSEDEILNTEDDETLNEKYIDLALEIIYDIEEEKGLYINKKNKIKIIKEIYSLVEDFYDKKVNKIEIAEKIASDVENPIIEGVNIPKLIISKIRSDGSE
jgi:DNA-binding Xre family transcriptional regulator